MSLLEHLSATNSPTLRLDELEGAGDPSSQVAGGQLPPIGVAGGSAATVESLLLSVASGDQEASLELQSRIAGLVRVNVRRVLRDATRSEAVTQETLAEVLEDAIHFDPHRVSAQEWLLTRAHQRVMHELGSLDDTMSPGTEPRELPNPASQMGIEGRIREARWEGFEPPAA